MNPTSETTSVAAILAVVLTLFSMASCLFCCLSPAAGTLATALGIFAMFEYRSGKANQISAFLGGGSAVISGLCVLTWIAIMVLGVGVGVLDAAGGGNHDMQGQLEQLQRQF